MAAQEAQAADVTSSRTAITPGDLAWSRLPAFARRVERALETIRRAAEGHHIGVSFSTGKDSTVVLDLVRRVIPDAPAGFFDSGSETEYDESYDLAAHYNAQAFTSEIPLAEMCRRGGYWGYEHPTEPDVTYDWMAYLVYEPSYRFALVEGIDTMAMGLRADESAGRRVNYRRRGKLYKVDGEEPVTHHLCPIADWSTSEVWAYIAGRGLRYHPVYDLMAQAGIPREQWRISVLLGRSAVNLGRYGFLRQTCPAKWRNLAAQFPEIARYT